MLRNSEVRMSDSGDGYDALQKYWRQITQAESWREWLSANQEFISSLISQIKERHAPVTAALAGLTVAVFLIQTALYLGATGILTGLIDIFSNQYSLRGLNAWIFLNIPVIPWIFSPFIHVGIPHFAANVALLMLYGKYVEPQFPRKYFILWFLLVTAVVKPVDAFISLATSPEPHAAVYGISDFVYSLSFFSALTLWSVDHRNELQSIALIVGVLSILSVVLDVAGAVLAGSVQPVNWAHLVGGLLGIAVAWTTAK